MNPISAAYTLAYEISPIWLVNGIAPSLGLPIVALTEGLPLLANGLLGELPSQPFFTWRPMPGSTIWESEISEYPFYTNQIAANAQVQRPLKISMLGHCPATKGNPMTIKTANMMFFQAFIQNHINAGGTFHVFTPSYIYYNCLLLTMTDVSTGETNQAQVSWQLDFIQPLLTFPGANGILGNLLEGITNGRVIQPNATGAITPTS